MTGFPPDLAAFASLLDAQPIAVRDAFNYCLCLLMVEAGEMRLVETVPGESGELCVFETTAGERFSVVRPAISQEQKAALMDVLREILEDEGGNGYISKPAQLSTEVLEQPVRCPPHMKSTSNA